MPNINSFTEPCIVGRKGRMVYSRLQVIQHQANWPHSLKTSKSQLMQN